jgi:hypothetical protein
MACAGRYGPPQARKGAELSVQGMGRRRRVAIVATGVLSLSSAFGAYFALPALAAGAAKVAGTPCTASAKACVDLDDQKAWLISGGKVTKGPIRISSGGQGKETPEGTFHVYKKDKDHKSNEFPMPNGQPAPMPNSVFFGPGGIAFHGGDPKRASAGCVHVPTADSVAFFNALNVGDEVQVTKSLDKVKGGFYGVNKIDPPTKAQQQAAAKKLAENRKKAAGISTADAKKTDDNKSDKKTKKDDDG